MLGWRLCSLLCSGEPNSTAGGGGYADRGNNFRQHLHLRRSPRAIASPPARTHHPSQCLALEVPISKWSHILRRSRRELNRSRRPPGDPRLKPLALAEIQTGAETKDGVLLDFLRTGSRQAIDEVHRAWRLVVGEPFEAFLEQGLGRLLDRQRALERRGRILSSILQGSMPRTRPTCIFFAAGAEDQAAASSASPSTWSGPLRARRFWGCSKSCRLLCSKHA